MTKNDTLYWNNFYNNTDAIINKPSDFCAFVMDYFSNIEGIEHVLDAGCGNGRDSIHLASRYMVDGVDNSGYTPVNKNTHCTFIVDDFTTIDKTKYSLVYSRFTFHSITNEDHSVFLNTIRPGTYLCIETRSDKSISEQRYFKDGHYRNFTNIDYLKNLLHDFGFTTMYCIEDNNLALYKSENPICIRVICQKN